MELVEDLLANLGFAVAVTVAVIIAVALIGGAIGTFRDSGTVYTCRCGETFGAPERDELLYKEHGMPVYKRHNGTRDITTRRKLRKHLRKECEG